MSIMGREFFCREKRVDRAWKWTGSFEDAPSWIFAALKEEYLKFDKENDELYIRCENGRKWIIADKGNYILRIDRTEAYLRRGNLTFGSVAPVYFFAEYDVWGKEDKEGSCTSSSD